MKSKRSKATDISQKIKQIVWERDNKQCIICGKHNAMPNAHYISRAHGGLGIPENVVTLCLECHHDYDNGSKREENGKIIKEYLKNYYGKKWKEENLIYNKWKDI